MAAGAHALNRQAVPEHEHIAPPLHWIVHPASHFTAQRDVPSQVA
jgi:hypothetical protein